jgi:hypothetical protein
MTDHRKVSGYSVAALRQIAHRDDHDDKRQHAERN